jgi:hypothetical protein
MFHHRLMQGGTLNKVATAYFSFDILPPSRFARYRQFESLPAKTQIQIQRGTIRQCGDLVKEDP